MKKSFPGYYQYTETEFNDLWKNCHFVFDTNVLLKLYQYSNRTSKGLIRLFELLSGRSWLPNHVVTEYHNNRLNVIIKQQKAYDLTRSNLNKFFNKFENELTQKSHPYISSSKKYVNDFKIIIDDICKKLDSSYKNFSKLRNNDIYLTTLTKLFKSKVGVPYDEKTLLNIYKECDKRFKSNIPPGYKDDGKEFPNKYGDYILWKQIIDYSKSKKKSIIFVTSEKKEDWWLIKDKLRIGPRPELINEFMLLTNNKFYMYHIDVFMERANNYLKANIKKSVIDETKAIELEFTISQPFITSEEYLYDPNELLEPTKGSLQNMVTNSIIASSGAYEASMNMKKILEDQANWLIPSQTLTELTKNSLNISQGFNDLINLSKSGKIPSIKVPDTSSSESVEDKE